MKSYDELYALILQRGVHTVFGAAGEGWFIEQNPDELALFLAQMQELGVGSVLEIGTGWKAGLARFLHDEMGWRVTSIDIHDYGHHFDGITFVRLLGGMRADEFGLFDLVIIDGDHSYDAVTFDHAMWSPNATKAVMFHDIAGLRDCEGVARYWNGIAYQDGALKTGYHELLAEGDQRGGIGWIDLAAVDAEPEPEAAPPPKPIPAPKAKPRKPAARKVAAKK